MAAKRNLKLPRLEPQPIAYGTSVRITGGIHAGKTGNTGRCFTGRLATPDRIMIELAGSLPGYCVSVLLSDVEVVR